MKMTRTAVVAMALAGSGFGFMATGAQAQGGAPKLNDAEIAHVAVTANTVDIENAKIAERRAPSGAGKEFRKTMIRGHTGVNKQAGDLAAKLHVTPKANAVSASLVAGE